jgi:hypothetical protein
LSTPEEPRIVIAELEDLLAGEALAATRALSMAELRGLRDRLTAIETGLSFGRRMAQGRLDIVVAELERRAEGGGSDPAELLGRLPEVLARQTRGRGRPRPVRDQEIPEFTEDFTRQLDRIVGVTELGALVDADPLRLAEVTEQLAAYERAISVKRREVHRLLDDVQDEIIGRYRTGAASVDDLLNE